MHELPLRAAFFSTWPHCTVGLRPPKSRRRVSQYYTENLGTYLGVYPQLSISYRPMTRRHDALWIRIGISEIAGPKCSCQYKKIEKGFLCLLHLLCERFSGTHQIARKDCRGHTS